MNRYQWFAGKSTRSRNFAGTCLQSPLEPRSKEPYCYFLRYEDVWVVALG